MTPRKFEEANIFYPAVSGVYEECHAHNSMDGTITISWKLTWKEKFRLLFTGVIWHQILVYKMQMQPQRLTTEKPTMNDLSIPPRKRK